MKVRESVESMFDRSMRRLIADQKIGFLTKT